MKIYVDSHKCQGMGVCEGLAPDHFEVGDDGIMIVTNDSVGDVEVDQLQRVVESCPMQAIELSDVV